MNFLTNLFNRIFSFIFSRSLWTFVGLLILAWLIWTFGPSLNYRGWYPLEDEKTRIIVIAVIFAIWLLRLIWRKWREARLNAQLLGQLRKSRNSHKTEDLPEKERQELKLLNERFEEAIELLKESKFEGSDRRFSSSRFSKQYMYQLPWYVFIGAPGSGKTTALINSGLTFPLAEKFGKVALKGVGGTRNCDWWFTDEAVLLDTAGRYTTHESDPTGDEQEWKGFLRLLTRYRGRQPINGVILSVSISDLLGANATDRSQHALVLKKRLQELRTELGIQFPVYVLVTKVDLLQGFESYFQSLDLEEQNQVWGFTFPYEKAQQPGFKFLPAFDTEFTLLQTRLFDALPDVLIRNQSEEQRAASYALPQQFANLRMILGMFLMEVFSASKFESRITPRGVYFTSGTQGGMAIDKVTGKLKKYLRLEGITQKENLQPNTEGKSYFLKNLLQEIVFRESGLAGLNLKWERRYRKMQWLGYIGVGAVLTLAIIVWLISYRNNSQYIDYVSGKIPDVQKLADTIKDDRHADIVTWLPFLDKLAGLPDAQEFTVHQEPMSYRAGLYQGPKLDSASSTVYEETMKYVLVPLLAKRVENALRRVSPNDMEASYEALRAYLMMYDPQHFDAKYLKTWVKLDIDKTLPDDFTTEQYHHLEQHLDHLFSQGVFVSPYPKNDRLVKEVRDRLDKYPLSVRAYSRLKRILASEKIPDATVVTLGGVQAPSVFELKSGRPFNQGVRGLYTYKGYWDVFNKRVKNETIRLRRDDAWVLGVDNKKFGDGSDQKLVAEVSKLYFDDYIKVWDDFLNDVVLIRPDSLVQGIEITRSLSSPNSPLTRFMKGVANETTLLRKQKDTKDALIERARQGASDVTSSLTSIVGQAQTDKLIRQDAAPDRPERMVDDHFAQYRDLATSPDKNTPAPIENTTQLMKEYYDYLVSADHAIRTGGPVPTSAILSKLRAEAGRLPKGAQAMINNLTNASSQEIGAQEQANLGEQVNGELGTFCRESIAGRYPFAKSNQEVAPNDFGRFFGAGQMMDTFFQQTLRDKVDISKRPWRYKSTTEGAPGNTAGYLAAFEKADVIRSVYFSGSNTEPSYKISVRPLEMDANINQMVLNINGQQVTYEHGPEQAVDVQWPGKNGGGTASITFIPADGASGISTTGHWALNKLLDHAHIEPGRSPSDLIATFKIGGRWAKIEFTAYTAKSPFNLAEMKKFTCPGSR